MTAIPAVFACEYVRVNAKLKDGRQLSWTHWVPNRTVDDLLGITPDEPYKSGEQYADEKARAYLGNGIYALWDGTEEEYILPGKIRDLSTTLEKKHLSLSEILMREAHLRDPRDVKVRPPRKRPTLQEAVDAMDDLLAGKITVNDFFRKLGHPQRSDAVANTKIKATDSGYEEVSSGVPLNIRPLFADDMLYAILEIRRVQVAKGIA